jgi:hypothetical protein
MQTLKEEAMHAIETLPEDVKLDDIMYRLYVIDKVMKGSEAIAKGQYKTVDELKKEIAAW